MNIYTQTVPEALRAASSKVVRMVFPAKRTRAVLRGCYPTPWFGAVFSWPQTNVQSNNPGVQQGFGHSAGESRQSALYYVGGVERGVGARIHILRRNHREYCEILVPDRLRQSPSLLR
jgi:hypothetical protein